MEHIFLSCLTYQLIVFIRCCYKHQNHCAVWGAHLLLVLLCRIRQNSPPWHFNAFEFWIDWNSRIIRNEWFRLNIILKLELLGDIKRNVILTLANDDRLSDFHRCWTHVNFSEFNPKMALTKNSFFVFFFFFTLYFVIIYWHTLVHSK